MIRRIIFWACFAPVFARSSRQPTEAQRRLFGDGDHPTPPVLDEGLDDSEDTASPVLSPDSPPGSPEDTSEVESAPPPSNISPSSPTSPPPSKNEKKHHPSLALTATPSNLWRFLRNSAAKIGDVASRTLTTQTQLQVLLTDLSHAEAAVKDEHATLSSRNLSLKSRLAALKELSASLSAARDGFHSTEAEIAKTKALVKAKQEEVSKKIADGAEMVAAVRREAAAARERTKQYQVWMAGQGAATVVPAVATAAPVVPAGATTVVPPGMVGPAATVVVPAGVVGLTASRARGSRRAKEGGVQQPRARSPKHPTSASNGGGSFASASNGGGSFASLVRAAKKRGEEILARERKAESRLADAKQKMSTMSYGLGEGSSCQALSSASVVLKKALQEGRCL